MNKYSKMDCELTIGLDLGNSNSYYLMLSEEGEILAEGRVAT